MKSKVLLCAVLLGATMMFSQAAYAQEQADTQDTLQTTVVYQTQDEVLSIEAPNSQWRVMSDPNYWFVLSDGGNTITIDHLANGEALPATVVAGGETAGVIQTFVSTKNEVFVIKGSAVKEEDLEVIMKVISTIKVLKHDTKTAIKQDDNAGAAFAIVPINETYYSTSDHLNVRLGCSTNDTMIGHLTYGEAVTVLGSVTVDGQDIGWYQISFNGSNAYASAQYLSKTKPEVNDDSFIVYAKDGSQVRIHWTGGTMFEDESGKTYSQRDDGSYYCITTDTIYATVPDYFLDIDVNIEGDPYGDLVTGGDGINYDNVNVEGDPYGDLVTGGEDINYDNVNVEGDPYGDLVTGGEDINYDNVNVEGDPYGDLVTGGDDVNVEG